MRKLSFLLVLSLILTVFAGCNGASVPPSDSASNPTDEEKSVEINVVTSYGGDDGNRQNYEKAYRAFEASSGHTVNDNSNISNEEWKAEVMERFDSGAEPDVLFYFTGADSNALIEGGKVVSIDEIRSEYPDYASNMKDDMLAKSPIDGRQYAVPVNGYWEGLYVNKKVLADCGVAVPDADTTWEQFLADCQTIANKGYIPIAASLMEIPHYWFEFCVLNNGSADTHTMVPTASADSIGQIWTAGLYDIKDLYERGFFPENTNTVTSAATDTLMIDDKAAFMIEGSWKIGWFSENASDINDFTVTYLPGKDLRASTDIIGGISMGYFITRKAWDNPEKRKACVDFVKAMTADEVVAAFGTTAITGLKNSIPPPSDANALVMDALKMTGGYTRVAGAAGDELRPEARSRLFGNIPKIVTGEMTAEDALDESLAS